MAVGTTFDSTLTRDQLIELAHKMIGVLAPGQVLAGDQLTDAVRILNLIIRETDESGDLKWTRGAASSLTLVANTFVYTSANGLPTNIAKLDAVSYRNASAIDRPMGIASAMEYETIANKTDTGDPKTVYLTDHRDIGSRTLYVVPMLSAVNTQSVVTGTDAAAWKCIRSHTSASTNRPITGANYLLYWESGGSGPSAWATSTSYTAPQLIRLLYQRPLFDFDTASDTPDFPQQWPRMLVYKLAFDLGDLYGIPMPEREYLIAKAKGAYSDIFDKSMKPETTGHHNRTSYF